MIRLYDASNYVRMMFEAGQNVTLRSLYNEVQYSPDICIYIWDGPNSLAARRKLYPEYKAKRKPAPENTYATMKLFNRLLCMSKAIQIQVPGYEADDVIAKLARKYVTKHKVHIHSNDADMLQLEGVTTDRKNFRVPPQWVRLYKSLVGDPSDNIPGIKGFGKKSWELLSETEKHQWTAFCEGQAAPPEVTSKAVENWITDPENQRAVRMYYEIIGFLPVPDELVDRHTTVGNPNVVAVHEILTQFLM